MGRTMGSTVRIHFQSGSLLALTSGKSHISLNLSFLICKMGSVCLGMGAPHLTSLLYSLLGCFWSVLYSDLRGGGGRGGGWHACFALPKGLRD